MANALTGEGDTTAEVTITQKGADWKTKVEWPKNLKGANGDVTVGGKATLTYSEANAEITVTYGN